MELTKKNTVRVQTKVPPTKPGVWDQLVLALIRPPKHNYNPKQLGGERTIVRNNEFRREDFKVAHEEQQIQLTIYQRRQKTDRIILYLHGNSSSRLEALGLLEYLPEGFALGSFDFLGCGITDEQYISLGVREAQQIASVVSFLRQDNYQVVLWGRSMGAVSALKYGQVSIIVADSPFVSLQQICKETAHQKKPKYVPGCMVTCCFPLMFRKLRTDVKKRADFDMKQLNIKKSVLQIDQSKCLVFLSGTKDTLINHRHSQQLYEAFKGENKKIYLFDGNHNSKRPADVLQHVMEYIQQSMEKLYQPVRSPKISTAKISTDEVILDV